MDKRKKIVERMTKIEKQLKKIQMDLIDYNTKENGEQYDKYHIDSSIKWMLKDGTDALNSVRQELGIIDKERGI